MSAAHDLLSIIVGTEPAPALIEIRSIPATGAVRQRFFPVDDPGAAERYALTEGRKVDTFVGMAPREPHVSRRSGKQFGGTAAIRRGWVLSADCDTDDSLDRLDDFLPKPTIIIASGSLTPSERPKLHPHWALTCSLSRATFTAAKKRLAAAVDSDTKITDAARVMRIPGTLNFKSDPPRPVEVVECHAARLYTPAEVLASTPELAPGKAGVRGTRFKETAAGSRDRGVVQAQEKISPRRYVFDIAGVEAGPDGKACCPFHDDTTPSLMVWETAERGWWCFGCERGSDIYDFAAARRGIPKSELHGGTYLRIWRLVRELYDLPVDPDKR